MKKANVKKASVIALIVVLIGIIIYLLFRPANLTGDENKKPGSNLFFDLTYDDNVQEGGFEYKSPEEIQKELNNKVDKGMINISMNLTPIFKDGKSEGNLKIMNEAKNNYPQVVEIYTKDTNELIYRSGLIPVNSRIENAKLDVKLAKGVYTCLAYFNSVDPETGMLMGQAIAEVYITIEN